MKENVIKMTLKQVTNLFHISESHLRHLLLKHDLVEQRKTNFFWIGFLRICFSCLFRGLTRHKDRSLLYWVSFGKQLTQNLFSDRLSMIPTGFFRDLLDCVHTDLNKIGSPKRREKLTHLFRSILVEDASVFHLDRRLVEAFTCSPGTKSVGVKLYLGISLVGNPALSVHTRSARYADIKQDSVGEPGSIEIKDRGWFSVARFVQLTNEGRFFVSRIQKSFNPKIMSISKGDSRWEGRWFQDCDWADYDEVDLKVKPYRGKNTIYRLNDGTPFTIRMIGKRTGKKGWYWYLYSLPNADQLTFQDVHQLYRVRWHIEEIFREIKSALGGDRLRLRHPVSVENHLMMLIISYFILKGALNILAKAHRRSINGFYLDTIMKGFQRDAIISWIEEIIEQPPKSLQKIRAHTKPLLESIYSNARAQSGRFKMLGKSLKILSSKSCSNAPSGNLVATKVNSKAAPMP